MYLAFRDVAELFADKKGVHEAEQFYCTVSDQSNSRQPKGLFIAWNDDMGELMDAIANGAIAAIWDNKRKLPHYTPTQFPVFFTNDTVGAVREILKKYIEKLDGDQTEKMNMTNFFLKNKKFFTNEPEIEAISGLIEELSKKIDSIVTERRG
jgi:UDP-N-acetylmuramyl pentapeptide synthase